MSKDKTDSKDNGAVHNIAKIMKVGAALVKCPKYFFLPITMKLVSLVEIGLLIIFH